MARRSARAKAQLIKASAGPTAQLVTAHAQTTAAPTISIAHAPTPPANGRPLQSSSSPTRGAARMPSFDVAGHTPKAQTAGQIDYYLENSEDGKSHVLKDAAGNIVKRYTLAQLEGIARRGRAGATLDPLDSAAFFRFSGGKTDREIALDDEQRKAKAAAEADRAKQDYAHRLAMEKQAASDKAALERSQATAQSRENAAQIKADAYAKEKDLARRQSEIDNGRTPDMTDEDYAKWMQLGGNKGRAIYDYSDADKKDMEAQEKELKDNLAKGFIDQKDYDAMRNAMYETWSNLGLYKKQVSQKPNTPDSDAPIYSQDRRFYWDSSKGNGGAWTAVPKEDKDLKSEYIFKALGEWEKSQIDPTKPIPDETRRMKIEQLANQYEMIKNGTYQSTPTPSIVTNPADPSNLSGILPTTTTIPAAPTQPPTIEQEKVGYNGKSYL